MLNNTQKKQVDAQRTRSIRRLVWQVRWFKNLVFPRFQNLLRKAELHTEICNRIEMVERERAASELSMGEAYMRLRKDLVDLMQREGAMAAEDEEVERYYESFGRAFDFESLAPRKQGQAESD